MALAGSWRRSGPFSFLTGWGWLWRIGGFFPNPDVALPVAVRVTEYLYTHPPLPAQRPGIQYLWHATIEPAQD